MSSKLITTRLLNDNAKLMREKFYENLVAQSDLMDKLSERLLTLELAIPGLYFGKDAAACKETMLLRPTV